MVGDFWDRVSDLVRRRGGGRPAVGLTGANARVGSVASVHIGDVDQQVEDSAGRGRHPLLGDIGSFLIATMCGVPGDGCSWTPTDGAATRRLDYVSVPLAW